MSEADIGHVFGRSLDHAASLKPKSGRLDLFAFAERERLGGGLSYEARLSQRVATFAQGWLAAEKRTGYRLDGGVIGGVRVTF